MPFYNKQGVEITEEQLIELKKEPDYWIVDRTVLSDGKVVSTVFLHGIDFSLGIDKKPILYETLVFKTEEDMSEIDGLRYETELEAINGHRQFVMNHEPDFDYAPGGHSPSCCEFIDIARNGTWINRVFICKNKPDSIVCSYLLNNTEGYIIHFASSPSMGEQKFYKTAKKAIYRYISRKKTLMPQTIAPPEGTFEVPKGKYKRIIKIPEL